jgi:hypothetical protein
MFIDFFDINVLQKNLVCQTISITTKFITYDLRQPFWDKKLRGLRQSFWDGEI